MAEQNLPKDVQQALENLTGTDKEFLKTVVSEKGELNEEALLNVSGGVSLSKAGTTALNWLKNNYGKVGAGAGAIGLGVLAYIYRDKIKDKANDLLNHLSPKRAHEQMRKDASECDVRAPKVDNGDEGQDYFDINGDGYGAFN